MTGSIYRVNLDSVQYYNKSLDEILSWAVKNENGKENLRALPEEVKCKVCGLDYKDDDVGTDIEEFAEVYDLS